MQFLVHQQTMEFLRSIFLLCCEPRGGWGGSNAADWTIGKAVEGSQEAGGRTGKTSFCQCRVSCRASAKDWGSRWTQCSGFWSIHVFQVPTRFRNDNAIDVAGEDWRFRSHRLVLGWVGQAKPGGKGAWGLNFVRYYPAGHSYSNGSAFAIVGAKIRRSRRHMCQKWKSSIAPTRSHQNPSTKLIQLVPYGTAQRFPLLFCADFFCKKRITEIFRCNLYCGSVTSIQNMLCQSNSKWLNPGHSEWVRNR